jgi:hypothetical protein
VATKAQDTSAVAVSIPRIQTARLTLCVLGTRPLITNRMSVKASHELLLPAGRKTTADKQATLKHNPLEEFRASPYLLPEPAPALIAMMSSAFKGAMATAALDLPGTKKAQIGRLVWVEGDYTPVYGTPRLLMSVVRSADINHTPDIRSRAILPEWAARVEVSFVQPLITEQAVVNLLHAAGVTVGVGDYRPEKGKGTYGQFEVVNEDDARFQAVLAQARAEQAAAMDDPLPYDQETEEMLSWWSDEVKRRGVRGGKATLTPATPTPEPVSVSANGAVNGELVTA